MGSFLQDGRIIKDDIEKGLKSTKLPDKFLDNIFIGRCREPEKACSSHSGSLADLNIWDQPLTAEAMVPWTKCL